MMETIYKIIIFFVGFIIVQGCVLPWVISNKTLPMWADIAILGTLGCVWLFIGAKLVSNAIRSFTNDTDKDKDIHDCK